MKKWDKIPIKGIRKDSIFELQEETRRLKHRKGSTFSNKRQKISNKKDDSFRLQNKGILRRIEKDKEVQRHSETEENSLQYSQFILQQKSNLYNQFDQGHLLQIEKVGEKGENLLVDFEKKKWESFVENEKREENESDDVPQSPTNEYECLFSSSEESEHGGDGPQPFLPDDEVIRDLRSEKSRRYWNQEKLLNLNKEHHRQFHLKTLNEVINEEAELKAQRRTVKMNHLRAHKHRLREIEHVFHTLCERRVQEENVTHGNGVS